MKIKGLTTGIHIFKQGTKVAFDENIGNPTIGKYARSGCIVVYVAPHGAEDEVWVEEAWTRGAEVIISRDLDIGNIIDKENYDMKWVEP